MQIESDDDDEEEGGVPTSRRSLWKTFSENSRKRAGSFFGFDDTGDHTGDERVGARVRARVGARVGASEACGHKERCKQHQVSVTLEPIE